MKKRYRMKYSIGLGITSRHVAAANHLSRQSDQLLNSIYNNPIMYFKLSQDCHKALQQYRQ